MSKIIEALKVRTQQPPTPSAPREVRVEKTGRELTQEQLAEIYFSATNRPRTAEPPIIIRVVETSRAASYIPWIVAVLAFLITAFSLFSTHRVLIDVKVLDEKSASYHGLDARSIEEAAGRTSEASSPATATMSANKFSIEDFVFEGAAYLNSSRDKNGTLTLINSSVAPFARATLRLEPPLDLSRSKIIFYVKGGRGGENIAFALKDKENIQGFYKGKMYPFPDRLTTSWQKAEISVREETAKDFDPKNVANLRFEFGSKDTGNKPGDLVLVKDLQWVTE